MTTKLPFFSGDQLRLARMTHGISLEDLSSRVAATRQYLHQLETGAKRPTKDMEAALASELGVLVDFFCLNGGPNVRPEQVHFRKQATTPASVSSQVIARGTMLDRLADQLDKHLKLPAVDYPDIPVTSDAEIELAAEKARLHWGLGTDAPITNMMRVAENAGALVTHFVGLSERVDALSMDRRRPIIVRSDAKESLCRQRFDLAHEVGHLVMHRGLETGDRVTEAQAHRFAGAFLIPASAFLREFPRSYRLDWASIFSMKLRWRVAARAIVHRAFDLGIINAAQYRTANIQLVKTGQTKEERYDKELPLEQPELLASAIKALPAKANRLEEVMRDLGLGEGMFQLLTGQALEDIQVRRSADVIPFPRGA